MKRKMALITVAVILFISYGCLVVWMLTHHTELYRFISSGALGYCAGSLINKLLGCLAGKEEGK